MLDQLRADGLYPDVGPVSFSQFGGIVPAGFQLTMSVPLEGGVSSGDFDGDSDVDQDDFDILTDPANWMKSVPSGALGDMDGNGFVNLIDFVLFKESFGQAVSNAPPIYYTLDGETDPRAVGGTLNASPAVMLYDGTPITVNATTTIRARAWDGTEWSALTEATFEVALPAAAAANDVAVSSAVAVDTAAAAVGPLQVHAIEGIETTTDDTEDVRRDSRVTIGAEATDIAVKTLTNIRSSSAVDALIGPPLRRRAARDWSITSEADESGRQLLDQPPVVSRAHFDELAKRRDSRDNDQVQNRNRDSNDFGPGTEQDQLIAQSADRAVRVFGRRLRGLA